MRLPRFYAALAVLLSPACARSPIARVHPLPLAAEVANERASCLASGGAFVMSGFEDGPRAGAEWFCVPNVGVRRVAKP